MLFTNFLYGRGKDIFDVSNSLLFPMRIKSNNESYVSDFLLYSTYHRPNSEDMLKKQK